MNTTKKLVILGISLLVCGLSFAKKVKKDEDMNPSDVWASWQDPSITIDWTDNPAGTVEIPGGSFTMGQSSEFIMSSRNSERRTVTVGAFYMDKYEVSNAFWRRYEGWVCEVFGKVKPELADSVRPDSTVWRDEMAYNDPLVDHYYRHKAYSNYPVVGVTWKQAERFCQWRTDRENEYRLASCDYIPSKGFFSLQNMYSLVKRGLITETEKQKIFMTAIYPQNHAYVDMLVEESIPLAEAKIRKLLPESEIRKWEQAKADTITLYKLPYEWIRDQFVFNTEKYLYTDYVPTGHKDGRKINMSDNVLLIGYRLPTEAEWEYAAIAQALNENGMVTENQVYPWKGYQTRNEGKKASKELVKSKANFVGSHGDMTGGTSNDNGVLTTEVNTYVPNAYGLYNMAGNVNEWVLDVYRETTHEEVAEYNSFRGNIYTRIKRDGSGRPVLDPFGSVVREYDMKDDKRNFRDGDESSLFDTDFPLDTTYLTAEQKESVKYDPSDVLAPRINAETRVYKGGSWNDRVYWLDPSTRRYLNQNKCSNTIGFRCAMTKLGSSTVGK